MENQGKKEFKKEFAKDTVKDTVKDSKKESTTVKDSTKMTRNLTAIILAAGKGTRMKSALPKVLHPVAGRPMISRVIEACRKTDIRDIRLVTGHASNLVKSVLEKENVFFYEQKEQLGTADAVKSANIESIEDDILILNGDHPLIQSEDIQYFIKNFREEKMDIGLVTAKLKTPGVLGRIVRNAGELYSVVEAKDASHETLKINEINTGIYLIKSEVLKELLPQVSNFNSQKEFYLTDIIRLGLEERRKVKSILATNERVAMGVNDQLELAKATKYVFKSHLKNLMLNGVLIIDPKNTYIEETVQIAAGSVIYPGTYIKGNTKIGNFCMIETNCFISDCHLDDSVQVKSGSYLEFSVIGKKCVLGPYARVRPESELMEEVHIGNFVEIKKSKLGKKTKAAHLAYVGDAEVGDECNIGCGAIFVNYLPDKTKHKTVVGNEVFVGSDVQLVAPLTIGDHATLGAGSVITKNVPAGALAVTRAQQMIKENYKPK